MPVPAGLVSFPGVDQPESGEYTLAHGITPQIATIQMLPQQDFIGEGGTLTFTYGDVLIEFPDCKVDQTSFKYDQSGFVIGLSVLDRRWKWAFAGAGGDGNGISGSYNTRREDGRIIPQRLLGARDLATLCLKAMGEQVYDVSQVPNDVYPEIEWEYELPAQALGDLADSCGCRVVLKLDNSVAVVSVGVGDDLPDSDALETDALSINPPERPDKLTYVCGRTRYQMEIYLLAVGLDEDGTIKRINDLSYMPSGGWGTIDRFTMTAVAAALVNDKRRQEFLRSLARMSVFRWYQIAVETPAKLGDPVGGNVVFGQPYTLTVPGFGVVKKLKEILLLDTQVELMEDSDGFERCKPAEVYGVFTDYRLAATNTNDGTRYWRGFSIDAERGLVLFNDQVFKINTTTLNYAEPTLRLRTAFNVRQPDTWAWDHYVREYSFGTTYGTGAKSYKHDESFLAVSQAFSSAGVPGAVTDNKAAVNVEADAYLQAALLEFQTTTPQNRSYAGLLAIDPDGAIQQVSWRVGPDGATTRASRNSEFSTAVPMYQTRRFFEQLRNKRTLQMQQKVNALARDINLRPPRPD